MRLFFICLHHGNLCRQEGQFRPIDWGHRVTNLTFCTCTSCVLCLSCALTQSYRTVSAGSFTVILTFILVIYFTNRPLNSRLFGTLALKQRGWGKAVDRETVIREITCSCQDPREGRVVPPSSLLPSPPAAAEALSSI